MSAGLRSLAVLVVVLVLAPGTVGARVCGVAEFDGVRTGDCCCSPAKEVPAQPSAERACCCEIGAALAGHGPTSTGIPESSSEEPVGAEGLESGEIAAPPSPRAVALPRPPARAPPPGGKTLLSLGTSLVL